MCFESMSFPQDQHQQTVSLKIIWPNVSVSLSSAINLACRYVSGEKEACQTQLFFSEKPEIAMLPMWPVSRWPWFCIPLGILLSSWLIYYEGKPLLSWHRQVTSDHFTPFKLSNQHWVVTLMWKVCDFYDKSYSFSLCPSGVSAYFQTYWSANW